MICSRIVIVGAQGTGKTTLAKALSISTGLPLIKEVARNVARQLNIKKDQVLPINLRSEWQRGIFWSQIIQEEIFNSFISDRSMIDHWAYTKFWFDKKHTDFNIFFDLALKRTKDYSHILYLPPILPLKEDNFRSTEETYRKRVDEIISDLLEEWLCHDLHKIKVIKNVDFDMRFNEAMQFINPYINFQSKFTSP